MGSDAFSIDTYCPACGADAEILFGRDCDCELRDGVVCAFVADHPEADEPIRRTLTARSDLFWRLRRVLAQVG